VGEVTDGPIPRTGPTRTRTIKVEVGGGGVAGFHELEISRAGSSGAVQQIEGQASRARQAV